jgi:hypothetical protein
VNALGRSDLNRFLFADIGTEANGTTLSVMSVFARQGSDPWTEAGRLAALSKAEATDSLARMIASMPKSLWALPDAIVIAARLTGMLPARPVVGMSSVGISAAGLRQVASRQTIGQTALIVACVGAVAAFAVMMSMQ